MSRDESRIVGWMRNSPTKVTANDNFAPSDYALRHNYSLLPRNRKVALHTQTHRRNKMTVNKNPFEIRLETLKMAKEMMDRHMRHRWI